MNIRELIGLKDLEEAVVNKINEHINIFNTIFQEDITHLFITNSIKEDGQTVYGNLWIASDGCISEVKNFLFDTNIDCIRSCQIEYLEIRYKSYDFVNPTRESTLQLDVRCKFSLSMNLYATGENCNNLFKFYNEKFKTGKF